jgi:hypothetical protein
MNPRFKMTAALASLVVVTIALRCLWLWQPERQLLLHQANFRRAVERRDWGRIEAMIDPAYADRWGYTRATGVRDARQWLGQFFALTVTAAPAGDRLTADGGTVTERWTIDGTGVVGAEMVKDSVNALHAPFVFQWKHRSWKPWDWTLVRVDNPELNLSGPGSGD